MSRIRRATALSLAALAFGATACGDDEQDPATGGAETSTQQSPQQDDASVDPGEGTAAPEGSPYGDTTGQEEDGGS